MPLVKQFPGPYAALFWAELAPRYQMLRSIITILLALCLLKFIQNLDFGLGLSETVGDMPFDGPFELFTKGAAIVGVLYCVPRWSDGRIALRSPWQSLAIPVHLQWQVLVTLGFHITVALLMGTFWVLFQHLDGVPSLSLLPVGILLAVAVQGQAAMYWCGVIGLVRGLLVFAMGFIAAVSVGMLTALLIPFSHAANICLVLVLVGILWCFVATRLARDGALPGGELLARIPQTYFLTRLPFSIPRRKSFSSPFWAQVWFEWRHAAMWIPIGVGGGFLLMSITGASEYGMVSLAFTVVPFSVFTAVSYMHNRVTPQYCHFALTRPITSQRVGRAKTVSMALAILLTYALTGLPNLSSALLGGETPSVADVIAGSVPSALLSVFAVYGLIALAIGLTRALISIPYLMLRLGLLSIFANDEDIFASVLEPVPGAGVLTVICASWIIIRALCLRYGIAIRWPREFWLSVLALLVSVATGIVAFDENITHYGILWYIWATPIITFGALFVYGLRTGLISKSDAAAGLMLFVALYSAAGYVYSFPTELSEYFVGIHFGHWCVLLTSPIVWYPLAVTVQRHEDNQSNETNNG